MTKSLTEQWRDGELHFGFYYVKFPNEEPQTYSSEYLKSFNVVKEAGRIDILAPVPSYDEYKKLAQKIHILNEANMKLKNELGQFAEDSKTIERLKEQLEIARVALGQIAMFSSDKVDAVQCAKAIKDMSEVENDEKR